MVKLRTEKKNQENVVRETKFTSWETPFFRQNNGSLLFVFLISPYLARQKFDFITRLSSFLDRGLSP